jgi:hypothetical protein
MFRRGSQFRFLRVDLTIFLIKLCYHSFRFTLFYSRGVADEFFLFHVLFSYLIADSATTRNKLQFSTRPIVGHQAANCPKAGTPTW